MKQTIILGNIITMDEKATLCQGRISEERRICLSNIVATIVDGEEVFKA